MPIYDFYCPHCSHTIANNWVPITKFIRLCPRCDTMMKTVIHPPAIVFKGDGWESNSYKPKKEASSGE